MYCGSISRRPLDYCHRPVLVHRRLPDCHRPVHVHRRGGGGGAAVVSGPSIWCYCCCHHHPLYGQQQPSWVIKSCGVVIWRPPVAATT